MEKTSGPQKSLSNVVDLGYDADSVSQPYTMAFCYPRSGPILIKGALKKVLRYMNLSLRGVYHYRLTYWRNKTSRGTWYVKSPRYMRLSFEPEEVEIQGEARKKHKLVGELQSGETVDIASFLRIPHNYIAELDRLRRYTKRDDTRESSKA